VPTEAHNFDTIRDNEEADGEEILENTEKSTTIRVIDNRRLATPPLSGSESPEAPIPFGPHRPTFTQQEISNFNL